MLNRIVVLGAMALTLFLLVWGLAGDTPYSLEGDEMYCVGRATEMARRNDLNPHWFAHPASTTIYPLVLYYHLLDATYFHGAFSEGSAENVICDNIVLTAYLPRFVNVFLVLACIPLIFSIGRRVFGKVAAYFAVFFFGVSPLLLSYAQVVRSEAPALFFSVLAIYFSLKLLEAPSLKLHILVGLAIGLGISSRYPMLALAPLFLLADARWMWRQNNWQARSKYVGYGLAGCATMLITFALTTPFFFLDFATFLKDMQTEKAAHGLSCDGLSTLGNFVFYLTEAIPREFYLPQTMLAAVGIAVELVRRRFASSLLFLYALLILCGTCLHPFHSDRWLVPILPIMALFAGHALALLFHLLSSQAAAKTASAVAIVLAFALIEYQPFLDCCLKDARKAITSTRPIFYRWIFATLPPGIPICTVGFWGGAHREHFKIKDFLSDPSYFDRECGGKYVSLFDLKRQGFDYFICEDNYAGAYLAEPNHYPRECRFFHELFDNTKLVKEVAPINLYEGTLLQCRQRGPTIRLYKIDPRQDH